MTETLSTQFYVDVIFDLQNRIKILIKQKCFFFISNSLNTLVIFIFELLLWNVASITSPYIFKRKHQLLINKDKSCN